MKHFVPNSTRSLRIGAAATAATAVLALVPSLDVSAQTMKVKGEGNTKDTVRACNPTPINPNANRTQSALAKSATQPGGLEPLAKATWSLVSGKSIKYCVTVGVANRGDSTSAAPLVLTLSDFRQNKDAAYKDEFLEASRRDPNGGRGTTMGGPPNHTKIPDQVVTISQPVPAHDVATVASTEVTLTDWRKRPRLLLTLTQPSVNGAQPMSCKVEFDR